MTSRTTPKSAIEADHPIPLRQNVQAAIRRYLMAAGSRGEYPIIYHAGDTTVFLEMELIGNLGIDLAMVPIGDYFTMGPEATASRLRKVREQNPTPTEDSGPSEMTF